MTREPALHITDLRYSYEGGRRALAGVSLTIQPGEAVALVGPNGAGKSTLVLHLNGILMGQGSVRVAGVELSSRTVHEVRRKVGVVFQDPDDQLFMPTVFDDVAFGPLNMGLSEAEVRLRVTEALSQTGLAGFEERAPHHLSGGEKRAVSLATILGMQPEILVLDEPTSGLDPRGRRRVIELLKPLSQTRLVVSHDLELVLELCARVVMMDAGVIVADGPAREVLADAPLLAQHGLEVPLSLKLRRLGADGAEKQL